MPSIIAQNVRRGRWRYRRRDATRRPHEGIGTGGEVVHRGHHGSVSTGEGVLLMLEVMLLLLRLLRVHLILQILVLWSFLAGRGG